MWEKIKKILLFLLIASIVSSAFIVRGLIKERNNQIAELQNQLTQNDSLYTIQLEDKDNLYYSVSEENRRIKIENNELKKLIKKEKENNIYAGNIIATLQDSIKNFKTQEDIEDENKRIFDVWKENIHLVGNFEIQKPFTISFDTISVGINLNVNVVETKFGKYKTYVTSPEKNIKINKITTQFNPYHNQNNFYMGGGLNLESDLTLSANLLIGYKKFVLTGGINMDKNWNVGVFYLWF